MIRVLWTPPFRRGFWNSGRAVTVTADVDADTSDETVTLTVSASGGGYEGRTATVVVNVIDNYAGAASASDGDGEDDMLAFVGDVTPEAAAAALFEEDALTDDQLSALDRLGNGNGDYDLGDLLSWIGRCRRGEASCGSTPADHRPASSAALLAIGAAGRRGNSRRPNRRDSRGRGCSPVRGIRRLAGAGGYLLAILLAASLTWSCADDPVGPAAAELDAGLLTVELTGPAANHDIGALLQLEGPGIVAVRPLEGPGIVAVRPLGLELYESEGTGPQQIVVAGPIRTGPVVRFRIPDPGLRAEYRVRLLQVTGEDYALRNLGEYQALITR